MAKAYEVVRTFESEIAEWAGAKYGVAVESCCAAIFLSLKYLQPQKVSCPKRTYPGVAMAIKNAGVELEFRDLDWEGWYSLCPSLVFDGALRFKKDMYKHDTFWCLSFHAKKLLPIGRGGMILTDNSNAYEWLKMARFDGRKEGIALKDDNASIIGYNMYLIPEQAARGLQLFELIKDKNLPDLKVEEQNYPDLSTWDCFKKGG